MHVRSHHDWGFNCDAKTLYLDEVEVVELQRNLTIRFSSRRSP